jgi:hypothetical protein
MKTRLYFVLPDVASARQVANDLLLERVGDRHMHFLAKRGTDLGELHEASVLQKTDVVHGAEVGLVIGSALGAAIGAYILFFPPNGASVQLVAILIAALVGAFLGAWVASMIGTQIANSRLKAFEQDIEEGHILLMIDVPMTRAEEIRELVERRHPEATARGREARVPAFP